MTFGLERHNRYNRSSNEHESTFTHHPINTTIPIVFQKGPFSNGGQLYLSWPSTHSLYTESELKKLHHAFVHPDSTSLLKLLKRASVKQLGPTVHKTIDKLAKMQILSDLANTTDSISCLSTYGTNYFQSRNSSWHFVYRWRSSFTYHRSRHWVLCCLIYDM